MVGLAEGARYLVEYPYGCAEQRGSRALAMLLAGGLGGGVFLPGTAPERPKAGRGGGRGRSRDAARGRSRRGVFAAGHRAERPEGARADGARGTSEVSVSGRRLR